MSGNARRLGALVDALLPELPGGRRSKAALLVALLALSIGDSLWLKGALFGSAAWRLCLWGLAVAGLLLGVLAYGRRG